MQKVLFIQTAFTGDVVLATALIEKWHQFFPEDRLDFLVRKGNEGLLRDHPFICEVLIWNKKENKHRNLLRILNRIRKIKYDKVINLQRFASTGILTGLSGAAEKIGFDKNPLSFLFTKKIKHVFGNELHEVQRNNQLIADYTNNDFNKPRLYPTQKDYEVVSSFAKQPYVCMMPASVWFTKQYAEEKWIELIDNFPTGYKIYLGGGPADKNLCEQIAARTANKNVSVVAGKFDFLASAALMQGAKMNYTNDSAPLHFASATDAPVTAIFCSTIPGFGFYPLSKISFIVQTNEHLSCKPCTLHGRKACPLGHFKCAYTIRTSQLIDTLKS